ncbi:MAG TPA: hypothetical protein VGQ51_02380 [Puia sp.]|jgi:hypothetical protein|nr:hypothetical protein [Puia sp.]
MAILGNVEEIQVVKERLETLKGQGLIKEWEVPYEHLLTRLSAAVFFLTPSEPSRTEDIRTALSCYPNLHYGVNENKQLSRMDWKFEYHP